jgi:hypothetical protein
VILVLVLVTLVLVLVLVTLVLVLVVFSALDDLLDRTTVTRTGPHTDDVGVYIVSMIMVPLVSVVPLVRARVRARVSVVPLVYVVPLRVSVVVLVRNPSRVPATPWRRRRTRDGTLTPSCDTQTRTETRRRGQRILFIHPAPHASHHVPQLLNRYAQSRGNLPDEHLGGPREG